MPFDLRERQWADYFGESKEETYHALLRSLKIRFDQKIKLEAEEYARKERLIAEQARSMAEEEAIQRAVKEAAEREVAEKVTREKAQQEAAEKARLKAEEVTRQKASEEKAEREIAEKASAEKVRLAVEEEAKRKAAKKKLDREVAEKATREKAEQEAIEKVRLKAEEESRQKLAKEKADREAIEKAVREKAEQEAAEKERLKAEKESRQKTAREKAKYEKAERQASRKIVFKNSFSNGFLKLKSLLPKTQVSVKVVGVVGIVAMLFLAGLVVLPKINSFMPILTGVVPTSSTPIPTKVVSASSTPTSPLIISMAAPVFFNPNPELSDYIDPMGVPMALVPAGEFKMGKDSTAAFAECQQTRTDCDPDWYVDEGPLRIVYLDSYYIDKYEVTNILYKKCVDAGICSLPWSSEDNFLPQYNNKTYYDDAKYENHPVVNVDWDMAKTYCEWRGASLPTEAQWEKGARGTDAHIYPWGNNLEGSEENFCRSNCDSLAGLNPNAPIQIASVGSFPNGESPYGLYDMAGNASEWIADRYSDDYLSNMNYKNPTGPLGIDSQYQIHNNHVTRGGSWTGQADIVFYREGFDGSLSYIGFRCADKVDDDTLIADATEVPQTALTAMPLPTEITDPKDVSMVFVPEGEFTMGNDIDDSSSVRKVFLDSYYIDKYEVTNASYKECVLAGECSEGVEVEYTGGNNDNFGSEYNNYPVLAQYWTAAVYYCEWRGARLPTDAEWEKAARGTDRRIYPWGNAFDGNLLNYCDVNCDSNNKDFDDYYAEAAPVGTYPEGVSPYGVYDMAGNLAEWVLDDYLYNYFASPDSIFTIEIMNRDLMVRGGSYESNIDDLSTSSRSIAYFGAGFRCADKINAPDVESINTP